MKNIFGAWIGGFSLMAIFFGALHLTNVAGASEEERTADYKRETIEAAQREFARQKLAGLTDDANRMLHPIAQAEIK